VRAKARLPMRLLFILIAHLLVTLARLTRPGGVRAVAAESLAVKHLWLLKTSSAGNPSVRDVPSGSYIGQKRINHEYGLGCRSTTRACCLRLVAPFGRIKF
jgi:hypothetical protein